MIVKIHIQKTRKMSFHYQSIESKLEMRQVQIIQTNTMTIYAFVDILNDHFFTSTLFLLSNETFNLCSTRREHSSSSSRNDDKENDDDDDDDENDENENENENDENDENNENDDDDDVENDETQITRRKESVEIFEENRSVFERKTFDVSFDFESLSDQNDVDVKSKKSEKNVDERRISLSSSFDSLNEFFNSEKNIDSLVTFQRRVASKFTFDSKSSFDFRRNSRRSFVISFEKEKRSISSEKNVESSFKRRRR
jgi:hypothetical protein